jgi:hypothetical protein
MISISQLLPRLAENISMLSHHVKKTSQNCKLSKHIKSKYQTTLAKSIPFQINTTTLKHTTALFSTFQTAKLCFSTTNYNQNKYTDIPIHPQTTERLKFPQSIPIRDPLTFRYQTPVTSIIDTEPITRLHTEVGPNPYLVPSQPPPTRDFEWTDEMQQFAKKIWLNGYSHELRQYNPFLFLHWEGGHLGKLEMEVFHKHLPGHPTHPEELGMLFWSFLLE